MASKRIWNVRLNVDAFNASMASFDSDQERLSFLGGLHSGLNGGCKKDGKSDAWVAGWGIAENCLSEAKAFSDKQRERVNNRYHGSTVVEPRNSHGTTELLPNEQSTIYNLQSKNPQTNKLDARDETDIRSPADNVEVSDADKVHMEKIQPYYKALVAAGCKIGANSWPVWKRLVADYSLSGVLSASRGIDAKERFADAVESSLIASRGQSNPGDAINPNRVIRMKL